MEQIRLRRRADPEIVTWGSGEIKDRTVRVSSLVREERVSGMVQNEGVSLRRSLLVEKEKEEKGSGWCCGVGESKKESLVSSL
jgi:hypothetical protein